MKNSSSLEWRLWLLRMTGPPIWKHAYTVAMHYPPSKVVLFTTPFCPLIVSAGIRVVVNGYWRMRIGECGVLLLKLEVGNMKWQKMVPFLIWWVGHVGGTNQEIHPFFVGKSHHICHVRGTFDVGVFSMPYIRILCNIGIQKVAKQVSDPVTICRRQRSIDYALVLQIYDLNTYFGLVGSPYVCSWVPRRHNHLYKKKRRRG